MKEKKKKRAWSGIVDFPISGRLPKPRTLGLTMVIDKGLGLTATSELLELAGEYIDFIKLGFGTSALYDEKAVLQKISLVRSYGVDIYPGGTFFEIAWLQNKTREFFNYARELGFSAVEISDGTIELGQRERHDLICQAKSLGFTVLTEVGKKDPADTPDLRSFLTQVKSDLETPADLVIIEGRESGKGIGVYDNSGGLKKDEYSELFGPQFKSGKIMWEAPLKTQQQELLAIFGPNVNLGNIAAQEIIALEALRVGLRGDTLKMMLTAEENGRCRLT